MECTAYNSSIPDFGRSASAKPLRGSGMGKSLSAMRQE